MARFSLRWRIITALLVAVFGIIGLLLVVDDWRSPAVVVGDPTVVAPRGVLFLRNPAQLAELWLADADGSNSRRIAPAVSDYSPRPNGTQVVYASQLAGKPSNIAVLDLASGTNLNIAGAAEWTAYSPTWSPADGIIVYERRSITPAGVGTPKLWLMQPDGAELGPVAKGGDVVTYGPVWSPDGTKLGFVDPLRNEIGVFNFSEVLRRVPFSGEFDWSPDSRQLVVSALQQNENSYRNQLVMYDLASEQHSGLAADANADDFTPRWSPDGSQIAFVRRTRSQPRGEIWLVPVTANSVARAITNGGGFDNVDPQWSPDGRTLLWTRLTIGQANVPSAIWRVDVANAGEPTLFIENATYAKWLR